MVCGIVLIPHLSRTKQNMTPLYICIYIYIYTPPPKKKTCQAHRICSLRVDNENIHFGQTQIAHNAVNLKGKVTIKELAHVSIGTFRWICHSIWTTKSQRFLSFFEWTLSKNNILSEISNFLGAGVSSAVALLIEKVNMHMYMPKKVFILSMI